MLPNVGGPEILIVLVILVLLFGAGRMSSLARSVGSGIKEFRDIGRFDGKTSEREPEEKREPAELVAASGDESVRETK